MKIINYSLLLIAAIHSAMYAGFGGYAAQQISDATQQTRNIAMQTPATTTSTTNGNCPATNTCNNNNAAYYLTPFQVQLLDQNNRMIHSHTINVPTSFTLSNIMLIVHIFPPSNIVNGATVAPTTSQGQESTYLVSYTLKDPSGTLVYKEFSQNITLAALPHQILMLPLAGQPAPAATATATTPQAATFQMQSGNIIAQSPFLPALATSSLTKGQRQQIFNGISPISQKFLFTLSGSQYTCIPISGMFDADNTTQTPTLASNPMQLSATTAGQPLSQISITFNDSANTSIIFDANETLSPFNTQDLQKGLALNVIVYPSQANNSFPVVTTLRTLDGLKLRKKYALPAPTSGAKSPTSPLGSLPNTVTIAYNNNTILTTSFLSSGISSSSSAFNIIGPLNLRFVMLSNSAGTKVNVVML